MKRWILLIVLFGNLWIWRIFSFNFLLGVLILFTSLALYKNYKISFVFLIALLLFFQFKTTEISSLTLLSNDDIRVKDMRLKEYPYSLTRVGWWLEGRKETIAFFRILKNFSEVIDPNLYFFANHPRERVGYVEFEKFPYIFLPFFIWGLFSSVKKLSKNYLVTFLPFVLPIILISFTGLKNSLGPFSLFPWIVTITAIGIGETYKRIYKYAKN